MNTLVIDKFPQDFLDALAAMPLRLTYVPDADRAAILPLLADTEILILNSKIQVDREAADAAPRLRRVIRAGVGMDHIDLEYLASRGVEALFTAGANADSVGEQAVGMLLALRHNLLRADQEVRQFIWRREANRGAEIGGKTVGIIGYGHTGRAVARKLSGFGCRVLAYDKYLSGYGDAFAAEAPLEQIYAEAEILTLHVPLTAETRHWIDSERIARFAQPFLLLNLARGPIVHLGSLLAALDSGQIPAAALDVLENERMDKLTDAQRAEYADLFARQNVIVTPHIGGWSVESLRNINNAILRLVAEILPG
ncbi:MAG: NAD(P)-dependent oxidoreductase [Bacteroidia bacterium]|nr:NAD(P)-dependent oxidoreductase [Bacteroidia bacterium]